MAFPLARASGKHDPLGKHGAHEERTRPFQYFPQEFHQPETAELVIDRRGIKHSGFGLQVTLKQIRVVFANECLFFLSQFGKRDRLVLRAGSLVVEDCRNLLLEGS